MMSTKKAVCVSSLFAHTCIFLGGGDITTRPVISHWSQPAQLTDVLTLPLPVPETYFKMS